MIDHEVQAEGDINGGIHCRICRRTVILINPLPPEWAHVGDIDQKETND